MSSNATSTTASDPSQRRRSSNSGLFANLSQYKRETDAHAQRRTSISEQTAQKPGMIGSMFNSVFKGHEPSK